MPWSPLSTSDRRGHVDPPQLPALLDQVLAGLGAPAASAIVLVHERWAEVVGEELVEHARPVSIESGELRITVDSPAWASHLRWSQGEVLARLEKLIGPGEVTAIRTRVERR
jgi:predicted nucleic acid-binding Zn ribbon protein